MPTLPTYRLIPVARVEGPRPMRSGTRLEPKIRLSEKWGLILA
jgi:hypothetical protein